MHKPIWKFEHTVECGAPKEFAWKYWTNPANWDDPPARFEFDGAFVVGTTITTILPGQTLKSVVREVEQGSAALLEMDVMGARVTFHWRFEELATEQTRITQKLSLSGDAAAGMVEQAKVMEQSVPAGMRKMVERMEREWKESRALDGV